MLDRNPALVSLVLLLAVVGVVSLPTGKQSATPATANEAKTGGKPAQNPRSKPAAKTAYHQPLREYFAILAEEDNGSQGSPTEQEANARLLAAVAKADYKLSFLIATVPDPLDSHFGFLFDQMVDAIERAVEIQGEATLDRYYYPWEFTEDSHPSKPGGNAAAAKGEDGVAREEQPIHRQQPGVLLFRPRAQAKSLLVVFLVGETPTAGIHKLALTRGLDFIKAALDKNVALHLSPQDAPIKLMAPTFSGSAPSLQMTLQAWRKKLAEKCLDKLTFKILSGSALGVNKVEMDKGLRDCECSSAEGFKTTVIPDQIVFRKVLDYLMEKDPGVTRAGVTRVAVLRESNTLFGSRPDIVGPKNIAIIDLPFPLQISNVRAAHSKNQQNKESTLPSLLTSSTRIPIPLDEIGLARDTEPSMAPNMSAAVDEQVLARILGTISRENLHYVGIIASDPKDKIFLASQIRDYCPDVQLFTTISDHLLAHPSFNYYLKGTIVGSSYPLFAKNQHWSFPFKGSTRDLLFGHQAAIGTYNATVILLGAEKEEFQQNLLEYGMPFSTDASQQPPVWISVVSRQGLWPLEARRVEASDYDESVNEGYTYEVSTASQTLDNRVLPPVPPVPMLWFFVVMLFTLLCAFFCVDGYRWYLYTEVQGSQGGTNRLWLVCKHLLAGFPGTEPSEKQLYLYGSLAALTLFYVHIAKIAVLALRHSEVNWVEHPLLVVSVLLFLFLLVVLVRRLWQLRGEVGLWVFLVLALTDVVVALLLAFCPLALLVFSIFLLSLFSLVSFSRQPVLVMLMATLLTPVAAAISVFVAVLWRCLRATASAYPMEVERVTNLANGVSPLIALACLTLVIVLWNYTQLKRCGLCQRFSVGNPLPAEGNALVESANKSYQSILQVLETPFAEMRSRPWFWIGCIIPGLVLLRIGSRFIPSIETRAFDCFCMAGFALILYFMVLTAMQFLWLWYWVSKLLRQLVRIPVVSGYDRLPAKISAMLGRFLNSLRPRLSQLAIPVHQAGLLEKTFSPVRSQLQSVCGSCLIDRLSAQLLHPGDGQTIEKVFESEVKARDELSAVKNGATHRRLEQVSKLCLQVLQNYWGWLSVRDGFGVEPAAGAGQNKEQKDDGVYPAAQHLQLANANAVVDTQLLQWLRLAEDFVAMQIVAFIIPFFVHLRNLVEFLVVASFLLLLVVNSYSFQPQRFLLVLVMTMIAAVATLILVFFVQMDRDELVSRISRSIPNRLTLDRAFVTSMLTYVAPLVGILVAQSTDFRDLFVGWLEPILRVLK